MAIKVGGTTVIDNSRNIQNVGVITATALSIGGITVTTAGVGIATAGGTVGTGVTLLNLIGAGVSTVTVASGIATVNITGSAQNGSFSQWVTTSAGIHTLSNVGIGTTNPQTKLEINGVLGFTGGDDGFGEFRNNIRIGGTSTGASLTPGSPSHFSGLDNILIGMNAGNATTSGFRNVFIGRRAGRLNTSGSQNTFIGEFSGQSNTTGELNIFLGTGAGGANTTGSINNFIGESSGQANTTGGENNFFGRGSGYSNTEGYSNNYIGSYSAENSTTGFENNFFGTFSGINNTTGSKNTFIGNYTGISTSASNKIVIGLGYDYSNPFDSPNTTKNTQFAVGLRTDTGASKYWLVGDENFNIGIGTTNPQYKLHVSSGVGYTSLYVDGDAVINSILTVLGNISINGISTFAGITTVTGETLFAKQLNVSGVSTSNSFVKFGGTSSQFLKADGSVDSNTYITSSSVGNGTLTLNTSGTGLSGSTSFTANQSGNTTFTVSSNATSNNTANAIVARDANGAFIATKIGINTSLDATTDLRMDSGGSITRMMMVAGSEPQIYLFTRDNVANVEMFNSYGNFGIVGYYGGSNYTMYHYGGNGTPANQYTYFQVNQTERFRVTTSGATVTGTLTQTSDENQKTNIKPIENSLEIINQLQPVRFDWKDNGKPSIGVIAQDVEKVLPELVSTEVSVDPSTGNIITESTKSVNYTGFIGLLLQAIKEQQAKIIQFENEIKELKDLINNLK